MREESFRPGPVWDLARSQPMREFLHKIMGLVKAKLAVSLGMGLKPSMIDVWDHIRHKSVSGSWVHVLHAGKWAIG